MSKERLYRSPNGKILGVCAGLANWLRVDVGLVRLGFILGSFFTGGVVFFVYIALGVFLPVDEYKGSESIFNKMKDDFTTGRESSSNRYKPRNKRGVTVEDVKEEFDNLKSRVGKMEDTVFNKEKDWDNRFRNS